MINSAKVQCYTWSKVLLLTIFLLNSSAVFTSVPEPQSLSCVIDDLQRYTGASNSCYYTWSPVSGATVYKVYWIRLSDGVTSTVQTLTTTYFAPPPNLSGAYRFLFAPVCGSESLDYIGDEVILP